MYGSKETETYFEGEGEYGEVLSITDSTTMPNALCVRIVTKRGATVSMLLSRDKVSRLVRSLTHVLTSGADT